MAYSLGLFEFASLVHDREKLVDFLIQHGVLSSAIKCHRCGNDVKINKETLSYKCGKRYLTNDARKKRVSRQCGLKQTGTASWFRNSHLDVCVIWTAEHSQKLGGPGRTVEIDEAKIGRRKYNYSRFIQSNWVFGGFERESKKIFIAPVQERMEQALLACIKEWILPGTTVVFNCWKLHIFLNNEDVRQLTVDHSYKLVKPENGMETFEFSGCGLSYLSRGEEGRDVHTQRMERVWREVRGNTPRYETKSDHIVGYLCEYLFKRAYSRLERIEVFFDILAELYPPISTSAEAFNGQESITSTI